MTEDSLEAVSSADASLDDIAMPTFVITDDAAAAVWLIAARFGADPSLEVARLRFGHQTRYLKRQALYGLLITGPKGFGQGTRAALPGLPGPGQQTEYEFRCPVPGCPESPVSMLAFSEPPECLRHHVPLEFVRTKGSGT
jgi:hypothetical protein